MDHVIPPSDQKVHDWLRDGPVMHWCVDNQAFFPCCDTLPGSRQRADMLAFGHQLAGFTWENHPCFITLNIQEHVSFNTIEEMLNQGFEADCTLLNWREFKTLPYNGGFDGIWIDLFNKHYHQQYTCVKSSTRLKGKGELLIKKVDTFNSRKIFITGGYGEKEKCIGDAVETGTGLNCDLLLDPDLLWSYDMHRMTYEQVLDEYKDYKNVLVTEPGQVTRVLEQMRNTP